jgi:hypothetical protein
MMIDWSIPTRVEGFRNNRNASINVKVDEKMESHHRRLVPPPLLKIEHPDDELLEDCVDNHDYPSTPGTMKTASTLDSTRSRESVLVQVGQPFDEPPSEDDDDEDQVMEEKKDELEPITTTAAAAPLLLTPSSNNSNNDDARSILMLMSTFGRSQLMHQERAMMLFESMGIPYKCMDGSAPDRKDERNALFQLSGLRGIYPQFFLVQGDTGNNDKLRCLGDYDAIEGINEASTLPNDVLQDNPTILTWDRLMGKTKSERVAAIKLAKDSSCRI